MNENDRVLIEALTKKHDSDDVDVVVSMSESLKTFTTCDLNEKMIQFEQNPSYLILSSCQSDEDIEDVQALRPMEDKMQATPINDSSVDALTVPSSEDQLAWYLQSSYYYEKTKDVYNYATSFRGVAALAWIGETSANYVLKKTGLFEDIQAIDHTITPVLRSIDNKVEEKVTAILSALLHGQDYLLSKKNSTVENVSTDASSSTVATANNVAESTVTKTKDVINNIVEKVTEVTCSTSAVVTSSATSTLDIVSSNVALTLIALWKRETVLKTISRSYGTLSDLAYSARDSISYASSTTGMAAFAATSSIRNSIFRGRRLPLYL